MAEKQIASPALVSVVMRTLGDRPREIRRAIASVAANTWHPIEVVVVYQGPVDERWADIQQLAKEFPEITLQIVRNEGVGDRRAENLNIGWQAAKGQYIGFLDDDDTLEPAHVELLLRAIENTKRNWAYAQVILRKEDDALNVISESRPFRRHAFSLKTLWDENFLPIHSFLIDRAALNVSMQNRPFCEELDRSEDWDFLLRLAFHHEPAVLEDFTAVYYVSTGTRNTNLSLMDQAGNQERERLNREAWLRCKRMVEQRKAELIASVWWARDFFKSEQIKQDSPSKQSSGALSLRQRIVRKLIRILERGL